MAITQLATTMMGLVQFQKPERKGIVEKPAMFKGDNSDNARLFRNAFVVYMSDNEKYFARDQQGHVLRDANGAPIIDNPKAIKSALSYMTDKAAIWARPHIEKIANGGTVFNDSWAQFITEYKLKFEL